VSSPTAIVISTRELEFQAPAKSSRTLPTPPSNSISSHRLLPRPSTATSAAPALMAARPQRTPLAWENRTTVLLAPVFTTRFDTLSPPSSTSASTAPSVSASAISTAGENPTLAVWRGCSRETTRIPPCPTDFNPRSTDPDGVSKSLMGR
jgi:hypothetical protein